MPCLQQSGLTLLKNHLAVDRCVNARGPVGLPQEIASRLAELALAVVVGTRALARLVAAQHWKNLPEAADAVQPRGCTGVRANRYIADETI